MKILVVFTGGTIACSSDFGILHTDTHNSFLLLDMYSKADNSVIFVTETPYMILSENLDSSNLFALYNCIKNLDLSDFDGVIVTHGTDTLQYTSAFLGYAFSNLQIPLVLVSANFPLSDSRSNGLINFSSAVDFIKSGGGRGVFVSYNNKSDFTEIHRATRLLPHAPYSDYLTSIFNINYGIVENHKFIKNSAYAEKSDKLSFDEIDFDGLSVLKISPYPDMKYPTLNNGIKAVLLETYHSGTLNTKNNSLKEFCGLAKELNIPVFLTGNCDGFNYESKLLFDSFDIKILPVASPISMYIKLLTLPKDRINDVFLSCGGDFSENLS